MNATETTEITGEGSEQHRLEGMCIRRPMVPMDSSVKR